MILKQESPRDSPKHLKRYKFVEARNYLFKIQIASYYSGKNPRNLAQKHTYKALTQSPTIIEGNNIPSEDEMATAVEVARLKLKMAKQKQRYMGMMNPALTTVVSNTAQDRHNEPHTIIIKVQKEEKVPKFDGQPDSVEPYCAALTTALAMMKGKGYKDPEGELLNKLSTGMETNVSKMWFSTLLEQGMPKTLSVYCDKVRASFVQQTSYLNKDLELGKLKQGSEETISLYALRLQTKAKELGIDSESDTAKLSFLRGLENQKVKQATGKVLAGRLGMMKLEELVKAANTNYSLQAMDYSHGQHQTTTTSKTATAISSSCGPQVAGGVGKDGRRVEGLEEDPTATAATAATTPTTIPTGEVLQEREGGEVV